MRPVPSSSSTVQFRFSDVVFSCTCRGPKVQTTQGCRTRRMTISLQLLTTGPVRALAEATVTSGSRRWGTQL